MKELKPCPFCGKSLYVEDSNHFHSSGIYWRYDNELRQKVFIRFIDATPNDNKCYEICCPESKGGCGAEMSGDSKEETIYKWNRRF